jgi:hypothetical protein
VPDLIVGPASMSTGGDVKVIDGTRMHQLAAGGQIADSALLASFTSFEGYVGGVRVAAGNVTGEGFSDFAVAAITGVTQVKVFDGKTLAVLSSVTLTRNDVWGAGLSMALGDVNNDGKDELFLAYNSGGDTLVHTYDALTGAEESSFDPFVGFKGAVGLAAVDRDNDGRTEFAVTSENGSVSHFKIIDLALTELTSFYVPGMGTAGLRVGGE